MTEMLVAISRKLIFGFVIIGFYKGVDWFLFPNFLTREVIKDDAKAIALLYGLLAIAVALA